MPFQILSLSGGGYLGLYTISILAELEQHTGRPIASSFDLLAGTSIGGILALGLAAEKPAEQLQKTFERNGTSIFSRRPAPRSCIGEVHDFLRSFWSAKYGSRQLRRVLIEIFGEDILLGCLKHPVIVPAVNLTKGKPQIFKTDHHPDFKVDHLRKIVDVAMATSAAPTYFPVAEVGDELFVDGGLYANSPDLIALHEAEYFFGCEANDVVVLSIGTTTAKFSFSHRTSRNLGIFGWKGRLAQTLLSSQQLDVAYMLRHKLKERYLRIDAEQSKEQERDLALDVATEAAQKTIRGLAASTIQEVINDPVLTEILKRTAPPPKFHHRNSGQAGGS